MLKRLQRKDGGRPQRGGQERGDMENQEADQKFGSCPWVSNRFELCVNLWSVATVLEPIASGDGVNAAIPATAADGISGAEFGSG